MESTQKGRKRCLQLVLWSSFSFISRATFATCGGTHLWGTSHFVEKLTQTFFLSLLSSCLSMGIQSITQTQPSASTPTEPFLVRVHNRLCDTSTPLQHLLEKKEEQSGWVVVTELSSPPANPMLRPPQHHQHPMLCPVTPQNIVCSRIALQNWYINRSVIFQIACYAFSITVCKFTAIHYHLEILTFLVQKWLFLNHWNFVTVSPNSQPTEMSTSSIVSSWSEQVLSFTPTEGEWSQRKGN